MSDAPTLLEARKALRGIASNTWLFAYEREKAEQIAETGSDAECLVLYEQLENRRVARRDAWKASQ